MVDAYQQWQAMQQRCEKITDKLGMSIDPGILDSIIVFNLLGITTRQSCEGHLDWGEQAPWITFTTPGAESLYQEAVRLHREALDKSREKHFSHEEAVHLFAPSHEQRKHADKKHAEDQEKVIRYLEAFYHERKVPYHCSLIVYSRTPGTSILESQGAKLQVLLSPYEQERSLKTYQEEMRAFAAFLKTTFFQEHDIPKQYDQ